MVAIIKKTPVRIPGARIRRDMGILFSLLRIPLQAECEIVFVGAAEMRKLNARFRRKDHSTTVLSFNMPRAFVVPAPRALGEIYVCPDDIKKQGLTFSVHNARVGFYPIVLYYIIHGLLHLCGYDHEGSRIRADRMRRKEQSLWHALVDEKKA